MALGAAIVGTGFIGPVHLEALRRLGLPVAGVLGSSPEKSRAAADALNLPRGYASLDELLGDPAVAVVHLTSPNRHHFDQCRAALAAGKHVVCEKPLAMTVAETAELTRLAAEAGERGVRTCVNYNVRYYPLCLELRQRVAAGELGTIAHVFGSYMQDWLLKATDFNWRVLSSEGGPLRAVADIGTHWLDLIQFITGLEVTEVCADLGTLHPVRQTVAGSVETFSAGPAAGAKTVDVPIDTEDFGSILLRFAGGAKGAFAVSQVTAGRKNCVRFDVSGATASAAWDSEEPNALHLGRRDRANLRLTRDPALLSAEARPYADYPGGHAEGFPDTFKQLFKAFYGHVRTGVAPPVPYPTFADGDREARICEAILASSRGGGWVRV